MLNTPQGREKLQKMTIKVTKSRTDLEKLEKDTTERKSLAYYLNTTKTICHKYIRERDRGKPCVSCAQPWKSDFDAGHWKKAELFSTLKFNENNIFGQCIGCNRYKDGNVQEYDNRVHLRIGIEGKAEIERLAGIDKQLNHKWDRSELLKIRDYYKEKLKKLNNL